MGEKKKSGPERFICFKLSKVMRRIHRYYEVALAPYEITPVQFYVLNALFEADGQKFKDLAENVCMDGSTLTGILDRMERGGFVERRPDPDDRRSLLIFLTEKAIRLGPEMVESAARLDREIKERFAREKFAAFIGVLDSLFDAGDYKNQEESQGEREDQGICNRSRGG